MIKFSDEDYDFLSTQENKLRRAVYGRIATSCSEDEWMRIVYIYNHYFSMSEPYKNFCNSCRFIILEKIGKIYFRMKETRKEKDVNIQNGEENNVLDSTSDNDTRERTNKMSEYEGEFTNPSRTNKMSEYERGEEIYEENQKKSRKVHRDSER